MAVPAPAATQDAPLPRPGEVPHRAVRPARLPGARTPHADLVDNTTWDLVADIEQLREHLGIERWQVFGGSWGSTLALAYAETHPQRGDRAGAARHLHAAPLGAGVVLPGRRSRLFPDAWEQYLAPIPEVERHDLISAFHRRLTCDGRSHAAGGGARLERVGRRHQLPAHRPGFRRRATRTPRSRWRSRASSATTSSTAASSRSTTSCCATSHRIQDIPGVIVHGRYDVVCPVANAWDLHKAWPKAELVISRRRPAIPASRPRHVDALVPRRPTASATSLSPPTRVGQAGVPSGLRSIIHRPAHSLRSSR